MHKMQPPSEYCTKFNSTFVICLKFVFIEMLDKLIHTQCVGTRLYIGSCLLCELTALQLVSTVTRSDPGSHNRLDLIHSLVPTHFVCIILSSISIKTNFKQITKVELNFVQYSRGRLHFVHDVMLFLPFIHQFIRCYRVCDKSNMKSATFGAGTAYIFGAPKFTPSFQWGSVCTETKMVESKGILFRQVSLCIAS